MGGDLYEMHRRDAQKGQIIEHQQETYFKGPCEFDLEVHKNKVMVRGMAAEDINKVSKRYDPWGKAFNGGEKPI